jgi:co-chaperonin GroES (HSP10)
MRRLKQLIKVILHRVLVDRDEPEDTNATKTQKEMKRLGLISTPSQAEELEKQARREAASMDKGRVLALGETAFRDYGIDCPIKVGDYISYAKFGGKDIIDPDDEKTYVVINDEDVVAILTRKEPLDG